MRLENYNQRMTQQRDDESYIQCVRAAKQLKNLASLALRHTRCNKNVTLVSVGVNQNYL